MKAALLMDDRRDIAEDRFVEVTIWQVPQPVRASAHSFKYRLAFVVGGVCVLRYDNEAGKGDHKHVGAVETPYTFTTLDQLVEDFWLDVDQWRS